MRDNDTGDSRDGMRVVGEATNQAEAFQAAQKTAPDIFILDLDLRAENGLDFVPKLISSFPAARVIVLTSSTEIEAHQRAVQSGAMGLVLKEQGAEVLIAAIEKVYSGEVWLARSLTASVLSRVSRSSSNNEEALKIESLTKREREIIALTAQGFIISDSTVRNHLTSILSKLELSDRFELVFYAYRHGLSKPPV